MGVPANGRTGQARIRVARATSLRCFMRPGERIGLMRCRRIARSPIRRFAQSPTVSWLLDSGSFRCRTAYLER
jgi:hypothetical protein